MLSFIDLYLVFMLHILAALVITIGLSVWSWRVLHKPTLLVIFWGIIVIFLSGSFFRLVKLEADRNRRWQDSLSGLTMAFAIATENMGHAKITLETPEDDEVYQKIHKTFFDWEMHYPLIASVYTIRKIDGKTPLIVRPAADINGDWVVDKDDPLEAAVPLGTNYDDYNPAYDAVLDGSLPIYLSEKPVRDKWGEHITAS